MEEETIVTSVDLSGISLPFSIGDVLTAATDLLGVVGPFVVVGIALLFAPKIIALLKRVIGNNRAV